MTYLAEQAACIAAKASIVQGRIALAQVRLITPDEGEEQQRLDGLEKRLDNLDLGLSRVESEIFRAQYQESQKQGAE